MRILLTIPPIVVAVGLCLFLPAGRVNWIRGWLYLALLIPGWLTVALAVSRFNPELIRARWSGHQGVKDWDRAFLVVFRLLIPAVFVISSLDAGRFVWSGMPESLWSVGALLHFAGFSLIAWSMSVNPHFEGRVRIQTERDHQVIDRGPYRVVRHPGYVGFALALAAIPLLLGSWWGLVPAGLSVLTLLIRTHLEDRLLREELEGYGAYSRRVRFRLLPWIW